MAWKSDEQDNVVHGDFEVGLTSIELRIAIEEEFGVAISDEDAYAMTTVGDMHEWLKKRISSSDPAVCLTQKIFYELRRAIAKNYNLDRNSINPESRLSDFLNLREIEDGWPFLQTFSDLRTPPLRVASEFLGIRLSDQTLTMRELVNSLVQLNRDVVKPQWYSEAEIWKRLVCVFVQELSVSESEIVPEASIVHDLGCS